MVGLSVRLLKSLSELRGAGGREIFNLKHFFLLSFYFVHVQRGVRMTLRMGKGDERSVTKCNCASGILLPHFDVRDVTYR